MVIIVEIVVIGSGSGGNATYIKGKSATIFIDAGITLKQVKNKLSENGIDNPKIDGLIITHEHTDHTKCMQAIINHYKMPYYINEKSFFSLGSEIFSNIKNLEHTFINPFEKIKINDMELEFVPLSHDARECLGIIINEYDKKIVYIADTGYVDMEYRTILSGADCYLFEANYDPSMEMESNRPQNLKNRVLGDRGHLSNEDSAVNLSYLITNKTKNIIFIHRSRDCNTLDILKETVFNVFDAYSIDTTNIEFDYAEQFSQTRTIEV